MKKEITEEELVATSPKNMGDVMMQQCKPGEKELVEALEELVNVVQLQYGSHHDRLKYQRDFDKVIAKANSVLSKYKNQKEDI